jgi:hypothetical protein
MDLRDRLQQAFASRYAGVAILREMGLAEGR